MDPHLLRTFVTVVRRRSFSAAAEELGYTQSAVSQQIAALEADVGAALLHRRPVTLTPAGARLMEHAGPLLLRHRAARADVLRATAGPIGRLTVVASPLACSPAVAQSLARARSAVTLRMADREKVAEEVASGSADLGFVDGIAAPSDPLRLPDAGPLTSVGVAEEGLVVVLPGGHPLSRRRGLALADLADALWLQAPAAVSVERLREIAGTGGFRVGFRYDGADLHTVVNLAAAGHGLTLLPSSVATGVPLTAPRVVHRVEKLHAPLTPDDLTYRDRHNRS
ncbi:LysR family transcriptional regulator [Planotetraspora sp. A-T 1434]|uniref:LysR family transcriptional regulator n=1 Tax=Planotetraspora sp. A-T 1434 TaxID=2979219 RepID=UPI0021BF3907|nr:LysR family transcriptional regulator [Planotetraspora sp. A-T 1434]MCT9931010.1 LysR family transcriptional regulator [Planotetraspora sp. A-T 1434]